MSCPWYVHYVPSNPARISTPKEYGLLKSSGQQNPIVDYNLSEIHNSAVLIILHTKDLICHNLNSCYWCFFSIPSSLYSIL